MKILSLNAGYFLGYDGTLEDYLKHLLRAIKGDKFLTSRKVQGFSQLVADEMPDAVLLQEVDQGSIRCFDDAEPENLKEHVSGQFEIESATKYSGTMSRAPFIGKMSNAILSKKGNITNHYLENGRKCLIQELEIKGTSIFSVHISRFMKGVREKQIREIAELTSSKRKFVIAGDFNFHKDGEAERAKEIIGAKKVSPGKTFPTGNVSKGLDMAFSSGVDVECYSLDRNISDHRPVVYEIET